jgi:hypothetical protein
MQLMMAGVILILWRRLASILEGGLFGFDLMWKGVSQNWYCQETLHVKNPVPFYYAAVLLSSVPLNEVLEAAMRYPSRYIITS